MQGSSFLAFLKEVLLVLSFDVSGLHFGLVLSTELLGWVVGLVAF